MSSVVYEGKCNCGGNYIGETGRNVTIRWDEYSDISKNSEPAKHLYQFPEHRFNWKILRRVPNIIRQRKIHEAYYVMCLCPTLNNQMELTYLTLFRNDYKLFLVVHNAFIKHLLSSTCWETNPCQGIFYK